MEGSAKKSKQPNLLIQLNELKYIKHSSSTSDNTSTIQPTQSVSTSTTIQSLIFLFPPDYSAFLLFYLSFGKLSHA